MGANRMKKLSNEALSDLEFLLADGYRYLVVKEDKERLLRMKYPSVAQQRNARIAQHKYLSELGKEKGLKTRRQVERENKEELDLIKKELRKLDDQKKIVEREFFEFQANNMPAEEDEDNEEFVKKLTAATAGMADVNERIQLTVQSELEIMEYCIQELTTQHLIQRLAQVSWEYTDGELDANSEEVWRPLWETWDEFENDNNQIVQLILGETRTWLMGGTPFFARPPSQPDGVSDT